MLGIYPETALVYNLLYFPYSWNWDGGNEDKVDLCSNSQDVWAFSQPLHRNEANKLKSLGRFAKWKGEKKEALCNFLNKKKSELHSLVSIVCRTSRLLQPSVFLSVYVRRLHWFNLWIDMIWGLRRFLALRNKHT